MKLEWVSFLIGGIIISFCTCGWVFTIFFHEFLKDLKSIKDLKRQVKKLTMEIEKNKSEGITMLRNMSRTSCNEMILECLDYYDVYGIDELTEEQIWEFIEMKNIQ